MRNSAQGTGSTDPNGTGQREREEVQGRDIEPEGENDVRKRNGEESRPVVRSGSECINQR